MSTKAARKVADQQVIDAAMAVLAAAPGLPAREDLAVELSDGVAAQRRGYYLPDEDERLRDSFHRYLAVRVSLWQTVQKLLPIVDRKARAKKADFYRSYAIALCASAMLWRTGHALLDMAQGRDVVWKKLDEAEPRFGIERKTFTYMYDGLTAPKIMAKYRRSWRFYRRNTAQIQAAMQGDPFERIMPLLEAEAGFAPPTIKGWLGERLLFRGFSYRRRHISAARKSLFAVFEVSGARIAELKQPFIKPAGSPKRVTDEVRAKVLAFCKPGDVFVTRHDDALSNVFLPGFWPHAALFIGNADQRRALGLPDIETARHRHGERIVFMESKKDGVLFRPVEDTLELDAFIIMRPVLSDEALRAALTCAMTHVGKLYDFAFDFASADRLACTELIYRTYHMAGDIRFTPEEIAGRTCLSAESLMNQAIGRGYFDVVAAYGIDGDSWQSDAQAFEALRRSFASEF